MAPGVPAPLHRAGFDFAWYSQPVGSRTFSTRWVAAPHWLIAAAAAALPAAWLRGWRRRRRSSRAGRCPACGYDLRATPGRCPECGAEPAAR